MQWIICRLVGELCLPRTVDPLRLRCRHRRCHLCPLHCPEARNAKVGLCRESQRPDCC